MRFFCDLHVHSRFSRATSKSLTIPELGRGAVRKGIAVLGTGDLTHPSWIKEMEEEFVEAEPGMYRLKNDPAQTRFILTGEISTIYKQGDKVRKVHHVIGAPDLAAAKRIGASLAKIGNILSDGRPILGITSRNLLEIVLESSPDAFLIPAHIWTPWFSALGSKSGFDTIKECYLDLEPHIFAVETGLSSDPPMNWMVKSLDRYHLISNSDAHSAEKLGREATVFDCELDYYAVRRAMATGIGLLGTVEFFPEEGKYHLDGHRDCGVVIMPEQTREYKGICPVCGKPLTVGVLNRVEELADRPEGERPQSARHFYSLIPLTEILSEIMHVASPTKKVMALSEKLTSQLGGELPLLLDADLDEIRSVAGETLALAVKRMRSGEVDKEAGYDGKFGRVRVFKDNEQDMLFAKGLIDAPVKRKRASSGKKKAGAVPVLAGLQLGEEQSAAVAWEEGPIAVIAGPGTGKTRVLVERIARLKEKGETPILAVTFTNRAAQEIRDRLGKGDLKNEEPTEKGVTPTKAGIHDAPEILDSRFPSGDLVRGNDEYRCSATGSEGDLYHPETQREAPSPFPSPPVGGRGDLAWTSSLPYAVRGRGEGDETLHVEVSTFHSLAARIMHDAGISFEIADETILEKAAEPFLGKYNSPSPPERGRGQGEGEKDLLKDVKKWINDLLLRQSTGQALDREQAELLSLLKSQGFLTYEGLIEEATRLVSSGACARHWQHVLVDEFQDINPVQYTFLKALIQAARSVMVIGDPNQAIYGFRGSSKASFGDFIQASPNCAKVHLRATHRLGTHIASASNAFIGSDAVCAQRETSPIKVVRTDRPYDYIAQEIEALSGGLTHSSVGKAKAEYGLSDMAVIVRTKSQAMPVMEALARASIPHDTAYAGPFAEMRGIRERIGLLSGRGWEPSVKGVGEQALKCIQSGIDPADNAQDRIMKAKAFLEGLMGSVTSRVAQIDASDIFKLPVLDALSPFYQYAQLFGDDVDRFVEFLKLSNDQSALGAEKVHVITAHAAKGLEFRCVFIAGLMRGVFPLAGSSLEEEQNLFYVGMTRAKDLLYLVCPEELPSEFVGRIPEEYCEEAVVNHKKAKPDQMVLFD